ncbi:MAG: AAA family ATPase [Holosporales bacterium]|jgi:wobble nucleotide-excising tRNase|nr:AAA family ATPase [Holosporales bacterium]
MIKELYLSDIATFTERTTMNPRKINFCYGSNGSGKTTISSVIANCLASGAKIVWSSGNPLGTLVYNRDFVTANFGETSKIGGIFTLGKDSKEAQEFISEQRVKVAECAKQIETFNKSKEKLVREQQARETNIDNVCWKVKSSYDQVFSEAFPGLNKSKSKFRERCLAESKNATQTQPNRDELKRLYDIAFGETRQIYQTYIPIDIVPVEQWEECDLLSQKISGSADTPIGKFIEYLGNSDWIKQGISYAEKADGKCPFCRQELPHNTYDDIKAFFDESYEHDVLQLRTFYNRFSDNTTKIVDRLQGYLADALSFLDYSLFKAELDTLHLTIDKNIKEIERKLESPSVEVSLAPILPALERINNILSSFNGSIEENNDFARNQTTKQQECIKGVWQLVVSELKTAIDAYIQETQGNQKGNKDIDDKIKTQIDEQQEYNSLISEKEATLTSIKPTAEAINAILTRFGFEGFSITETQNELGTYKIIRTDGNCVENTLSEGEYNFISFLYFYHLVYGSHDKTGIAQPKVVVIDDPISSLDSNVLFIVSTLTKQIIDDCKNDREGIKQVFILTHNVYFHKEVSFTGNRETWSRKQVAFWIIKKSNNISQIIGYGNENPIQTSYELLWSELKNTDTKQRITIFNTLRRILEYYFNVIGGLDYEKCINAFDGEDKLTCKSLISCINEGSHFITDDFVMQYESVAMESYIRVFKLIFQKMGHESHYNMMMKVANPEPEAIE